MPFEEGLRYERELFTQLVLTPESRALRHAFFAERAATKVPGIGVGTVPRKVERVAVIGAGTMGGGIAMNFLNAGLPVTILETKQEALDKGLATIRRNYEGSLKKGKLTAEKLEQTMALLASTLSYGDVAHADLVIEAVFEDIAVKQAVFEQLDACMKPGAIMATNTSTLDVDRIAAFTGRPQDVVGLHFFSPANVMKLLEVVRGEKTAPDVMATVMQVAKKIRKTAVVSGVCDGFIGNRMVEQYLRQAFFLLEEGASPQQVDRALEKFGMAMGPFRMSDLAGNDIGWYIRKRRYVEKPHVVYSKIADKLCELGRFGQKTGMGWYQYPPGRRDALPDPVVDTMIVDYRKERGITPRKIADSEIVDRCIYALVNEGARIVEEGIALRASDVDVVYLTGYGFPLYRGGPMLYADMVGLYNVVRAIERFAAQPGGDPAFWQPAPLLCGWAETRPLTRQHFPSPLPPTSMKDPNMTDAVSFHCTHRLAVLARRLQHDHGRRWGTPSTRSTANDARSRGCGRAALFPRGRPGPTIARQIARARMPGDRPGQPSPVCSFWCRPSPWPRSACWRASPASSSPAASSRFPACRTRRTSTCCAKRGSSSTSPNCTGRCSRRPRTCPSATAYRASRRTRTACRASNAPRRRRWQEDSQPKSCP
jgi:3-hydroxyacyl-CoA dehydrogenase